MNQDLNNLTDEQLIQEYRNCNYSLKAVDKKYNKSGNTLLRLFRKRNIDYNQIKEEYLLQQKQLIGEHVEFCDVKMLQSSAFCSIIRIL